MQEEEYLNERVVDQLGYYSGAATKAKRMHIWLQTCIILMGILVPVVVNLPAEFFAAIRMSNTAAITVLSLALAVLTGVSNFRKYGDLWLSFRGTEELLKKESFLFRTGSGRYKSCEAPFAAFVENVESIVSVEHEKFHSLIESSRRPTTSGNDAESGEQSG